VTSLGKSSLQGGTTSSLGQITKKKIGWISRKVGSSLSEDERIVREGILERRSHMGPLAREKEGLHAMLAIENMNMWGSGAREAGVLR